MFVTIFADASFCPNTKAAGFGGWAKYGQQGTVFKAGGRLYQCQTPTDAEYEAILEMLRRMIKRNIPVEKTILVIQSDCKPAIQRCKTRRPREIFDLPVRAIKFKWVKAHQGGVNARSYVNEFCDETAKYYMRGERRRRNAVAGN